MLDTQIAILPKGLLCNMAAHVFEIALLLTRGNDDMKRLAQPREPILEVLNGASVGGDVLLVGDIEPQGGERGEIAVLIEVEGA